MVAAKCHWLPQYTWTILQVQKTEITDSLRDYLNRVVENITDGAAVQRISEEFGAKHVQYRSMGFRPDFFALTADAVTTEGVLLDTAVHQASDVLAAWYSSNSLYTTAWWQFILKSFHKSAADGHMQIFSFWNEKCLIFTCDIFQYFLYVSCKNSAPTVWSMVPRIRDAKRNLHTSLNKVGQNSFICWHSPCTLFFGAERFVILKLSNKEF